MELLILTLLRSTLNHNNNNAAETNASGGLRRFFPESVLPPFSPAVVDLEQRRGELLRKIALLQLYVFSF